MRDLVSKYFQKTYPRLYLKLKDLRDKLDIFRQKIFVYEYKENSYPDTFLIYNAKPRLTQDIAPQVIYCFWTGYNKMSENRKKSLEILKKHSGVEVILIEPHNLSNFILPDHPLHPAYDYLSLVHKADYLRCYFMHHHGGGYTDVKPNYNNWTEVFSLLNNNKEKLLVGYTEVRKTAVAKVGGKLTKDMQNNFIKLLGNCAYICKPNTEFTEEWITELNKRLDTLYPKLLEYGYYPEDYKGRRAGYPVRYLSILGEIFHPLCLKHNSKLIHDERLKPGLKNYQ